MTIQIKSSEGKMVGTLNVNDYLFCYVIHEKGVGVPIPKEGGYIWYIRNDRLREMILIPPQVYFLKQQSG